MMFALPNGALCSTPQSLANNTRVPCSNDAKTRNLMGCPKLTKRSQTLVGRSSPYYGDRWRRYCCLIIFPIVDMCISCEDIAQQSCAMVPRRRFFDDFISSEPRAVHFSRTKATPCVEVWQTSNLRRLRLGEEKEEEEEEEEGQKPQCKNIMVCPIP